MISTIKNIKKVCCLFVWLFCSVGAVNSNEIAISMDFSVYNGEGSILLHWSIPDSIKVKNTIIYSQKFGDEKFIEIATFPSKTFFFLDTKCDPGERYFYKIVIQDVHDKFFSGDSENLPFGSCDLIQDQFLFNNNVKSVSSLLVKHIKDKLFPIQFENRFSQLLEVLFADQMKDYNWIEKFPSPMLNSLSETLDKINEIISNPNFYNDIMDYESLYRNHLFLTPEMWDEQIYNAIAIINSNWRILYNTYPDAIEVLNKLEPFRIVSSVNNFPETSKIILSVFHEHKKKSKEWYILSGDEYINLEKFIVSDVYKFVINIPMDWNYVSLMVEDSIVQTVPILKDRSILYTLEGDIVPQTYKDQNFLKIKRDASSLWFNEIIWDANLMTLKVELAGQPQLDEKYLIKVQDEIIWNIDPGYGFNTQYIDSILNFEIQYDSLLIVELQSLNDSITTTHELIILDSISKSLARLNDNGPWTLANVNTIGSTNVISQNNYDSQLVPQLFVLYQNYPNPFNSQTKITFDLLENAKVSLYVTDAKGRVKERILEEEFYNSGTYNFVWEAEHLSSGIYFISLQAEVDHLPPVLISKKMIYLK